MKSFHLLFKSFYPFLKKYFFAIHMPAARSTFLLFCLCMALLKVPLVALAQTTLPDREADFTTSFEGSAVRFKAVLPPLVQMAGAPAAFYSYHWEFGDGTFSNEPEPIHVYGASGDYTAVLDVTNHYDDGKVPRKKKKKTAAKVAGTTPGIDGVFRKPTQAIALRTNRAARAEEPLTLTLSYQNAGSAPVDGRLYLFFNEKKYPDTHFSFMEARSHFGETDDSGLSFFTPFSMPGVPKNISVVSSLAAFGVWHQGHSGTHAPPGEGAAAPAAGQLAERARRLYSSEHSWQFSQLGVGAKRNLFIDLKGTAKMLKDVSAIISVQAIFEPSNPQAASEEYTLEMEIVNSHDPNRISVSDTRVNYRLLGSKNLDYKVKFQNNGEGPAKTVKVTVSVPDGLNIGKMRPVDWYPKCPLCSKEKSNGSCLDTASIKNGLVFTFRNIYLPGSRQKSVSDYDSTQGFVKYRIEPEKRMPKRSFSSRADIVFDKNAPVVTNYSRTRFKTGLSPGIKAGYNTHPDSLDQGYFFLGVGISPYKSWKIYPQMEVLTGLKGYTDLPKQAPVVTVYQIENSGALLDSTVTAQFTRRQSSVSAEVPFLLRKNFSRFIGFGLGGGVRYIRFNKQSQSDISYAISRGFGVDKKVIRTGSGQSKVQTTNSASFDYTVFADLSLGMVRAGPNVGLRAGYRLLEGGNRQPFAQLCVEIKL